MHLIVKFYIYVLPGLLMWVHVSINKEQICIKMTYMKYYNIYNNEEKKLRCNLERLMYIHTLRMYTSFYANMVQKYIFKHFLSMSWAD